MQVSVQYLKVSVSQSQSKAFRALVSANQRIYGWLVAVGGERIKK